MPPEEQLVENPLVSYANMEFERVMLNDAKARYAFESARQHGLDEVTVLKCVIVALCAVTGKQYGY